MFSTRRLSYFIRYNLVYITPTKIVYRRHYHGAPFLKLYEKITGEPISEVRFESIKKRNPQILNLSNEQLQTSVQVLKKFKISMLEACRNQHLFCMNPITMDNYGEILKECQFTKIVPDHIIRYHTYVRSRTIGQLKQLNLMAQDLSLEEILYDCLPDMPNSLKKVNNFPENSTSVLTVRLSVLEKYLNWRLSVTKEEFNKYCKMYLPIKHKPMVDIRESIDIAENIIKLETQLIRRNGFVIAADPMRTKLILENVKDIAGIDICEVLRIEPAILKNTHDAILQIKSLLQEYEISEVAQRKCFRVFCMCPETVRSRLEELSKMKEFQILSSNPRVLSLLVHKNKMLSRLNKINTAKKQCYSLNHLVSSSKIFNSYISNFGNKICGRDLAVLITSSLKIEEMNPTDVNKAVLNKLRRHKYWLHAALNVIDENLKFLKSFCNDLVIFNNCQLLLYPVTEIEYYMNIFMKLKIEKTTHTKTSNVNLDPIYSNLKCDMFDDNQILSLILYEIERKYHFSGDGMWTKQGGIKLESHCS